MLEMTVLRFLPRRVAAAACALAVVGLGACGGSSKPAASSATQPPTSATSASTTPTTAAPVKNPDPCTLVTHDEAQTLAETPLAAAVKAGATDDQLCQYTGPTTGPTAQVEIFSGLGVKKSLEIDRDTLKHPFTTLSGIGDEAYLEADNVFVRKGDNWGSINVVLLDVPDDRIQAGLKDLAAKIAARL
jgi:hypothetical protein